MDERILNSMIDEALVGDKVDSSWITQAYNNIVNNLHQYGFIGLS